MAITKVINDAVDLNQTSDYSGLRLPVGTTGNVVESFTTDYLVVGSGGGTQSGGGSNYPGGGGAGGLRTSYNNSTTTTNSLSFPSGKTAIATYMLNNNANDVSGNYNGTEFNISYNTGKYGGAAIFNGSNAYIDLPLSTSSLFDGKNTLAVSFWFKTTTTARQRMFTDYAQTSRNCDITIDAGLIEVVTDYNQSTNLKYTSTSTYNDSNWHNVIVSLDQSAGQRTIYIDGSLVDTGTLSTNSWSGTGQKVTIGAFYSSSSGYSQYFDGSIDQLRVYNSALDSTNASNIYSNEVQADSGGGSAAESSLTLSEGVAYDVTVGGATTTGEDSTFSTITASGGGRSGGPAASAFGSSGGSGGGGGGDAYSAAGGNGTLNQGYAGGSSGPSCSGGSCRYPGGGGGGAAGIGENATTTTAGNGGEGLEVNIIGGTGNYYAGGGGGSSYLSGAGSGGLGGGGDGSARLSSSEAANDGAANTGGGGGGGLIASSIPALGGSGVVILRYPTANVSSFTTTGTLNTPSTTDTLASATYPITNTAYYKLDGNATDSSGNGNNGAESNVTWANGRFDQAAVFNGTNSYIYASNSVQQPTTNYSISVWSKWDSKPSGSVGLVGNFKTGVNPQVGFVLAKATGSNVFGFWADGTATNGNVQGTTNFVINRWYHVVGTYDGSNIKIYVDGQLEGTQAYTATPGTTDQPLVIGRWYGNYNAYYYDGQIDQVRIFSSALSSSQVTQLHNEHYQTKFTDGSDTAIVFTEGTGTVAFSGTNPTPPQGALRTNTSYSEDGSASVIEHYNGTDWKFFDAIKYCTTNTLNFPLGAGCIASYNLNNNVNDIGNTYSGTNNNVTFNASGKFGAAGVFNGSSSNISVTGSLINSLTSISYSAWVYYRGTGSGQSYAHIVSGGATNSLAAGKGSGMAVQNSNDILYIWAPSGSSFSTTTLPENVWTHLALTNSGGTAKLYMNGSLIHTASVGSLAFSSSSNNLRIGEYYYNGSHHFYGEIDQVRIFNKVLSASEVTTLYNNEIACS